MLLAIDVGLTNVKAVVFDATGTMVARSSVGYPTHRPTPDAAEQEPEAWWEAVAAAVRELPKDIRGAVVGIGVTGHMHALVLLDATGRSIGPSLVLGDRRAALDARQVSEAIGPDEVYATTGAELDATMPASKARYLARTDPARWARVAHVLGCKDYLRYRLCGAISTEPVDACATSLYDIRSRRWSADIAAAAGVDPAALPPVRQPWDADGGLLPDAAVALGLRAGLPVAVGAGDDVVVLGFGITEPGVALEHIGTTGSIMAVTDRPAPDPDRALEVYPHVLPDRWVVGGSHTTAGAAIDWAATLLGYPSVDASLESLGRPRIPGLAFLPTLAGERFPEREPAARGAWVGLSVEMSRDGLMRSVLEGVAGALGAILDRVDDVAGRQRAVRVAIADDAGWLAVREHAYGRRLEVSPASEPTALGLATLVAVAAGVHPDVRTAVAAMTSVGLRSEAVTDDLADREDPQPLLRGAWSAAAAARSRDRTVDDPSLASPPLPVAPLADTGARS